ncbi:MAG: hypothetical protein KKA19_08120 [Candidatus Margulisbacteria bacterium]|nr:hypothetical protein [Candidatus Margulisiibacteriota bacterium]
MKWLIESYDIWVMGITNSTTNSISSIYTNYSTNYSAYVPTNFFAAWSETNKIPDNSYSDRPWTPLLLKAFGAFAKGSAEYWFFEVKREISYGRRQIEVINKKAYEAIKNGDHKTAQYWFDQVKLQNEKTRKNIFVIYTNARNALFKSILYYEKALQLNAADERAHYRLGLNYYLLYDLSNEKYYLEKIISKVEADKFKAEALKHFEEASKLNFYEPDYLFWYSFLLYKFGRDEESIQYLHRVREINPQHKDANWLLNRIKEEIKIESEWKNKKFSKPPPGEIEALKKMMEEQK